MEWHRVSEDLCGMSWRGDQLVYIAEDEDEEVRKETAVPNCQCASSRTTHTGGDERYEVTSTCNTRHYHSSRSGSYKTKE
jgi:hypothetical protein